MSLMNEYFKWYSGTPRGRSSSVHFCDKRFQKAKKQLEKAKSKEISKEEIKEYVNEFLHELGMKKTAYFESQTNSLDYLKIKECYGLKDIRDIVWVKFTKSGCVGVVASSNDINFEIPSCNITPGNKEEYNKKSSVKGRKWEYNTSGIIIHYLKEEWNEEKVLIVPLPDTKRFKRGDIERGIGNWLIEKDVPILDFYSHNY